MRAARVQQLRDLLLVSHAIELRLHRVRRGGHLTERESVVYTDTRSVAPGASVRVAAPIRISIPSPSTSVACTIPSVMRIATDRPLQHTRNDRLRHCGGSLGSTPSMSPFRSRPAKPSITAC